MAGCFRNLRAQTFQELQTVWHVNMIRIFMYPEWYWLNGADGTANRENVQAYVATLASEAEQYGIYIAIVPYQLTAYSGSFSSDPYLSSSMTTNQGLPLSGWDSAGQNFLNAYTGTSPTPSPTSTATASPAPTPTLTKHHHNWHYGCFISSLPLMFTFKFFHFF